MGDNAASYHGLVNRGATCYLNSVLQVLFMTEEFREAVIRLTSPSEEYIDHHLKGLFEELLQRRADPYNILRALGVNKVTEQQDAAEYFERILKKTSENPAQIFHGRLSHRTKCLKCQTVTDSEGPFWHLPLELEDSCGGNYSVENGIKMFFTSTIFDGDNQLYCDRCDDKVDATRKYVITHHPPVLLLMLKRFDFSYQFMSYIKINCNADIPHTIEIPESQTYELYAVVEHFGDLRGGHYQAVIKSKDEGGEWFVFNDSSVTQLGVNPFPDNVNVTQSIGAYLLFYRRKVADRGISGLCSVRDYIPNIIQDQSQKENLQPGDDTETLDGNISLTDKEGKLVHMPTESEPEVRNPEKREINESEEINPDEQKLPEEQTGRGRQTERLSEDEIKYPQDITMEDVEEQEENRNQLTGEDQIQSLVAGETEPTKLRNIQTEFNYDHHVESAEPAALQRQKNLFEHQVLLEDRTDEERRKHETKNINKLITTSEEAGAADESENNKLLPTENMNYNHNQAENAALNKLEENEEIGEEASHVKGNLPDNINGNISEEGEIDHMSTESEPEVRNLEKREINESEEINPHEQRLPEEQTGRGRQTERLSEDEIKYLQDITMEDVEKQKENRNQLTGEDQIQSLDAGETEPTKLRNIQTEFNYDHHVESAEPAALQRQKNLFEHQVLLEDRTDEERRKHETKNINKLITTSEEAGAADESENNKPLPAENMNYNHNQAENAALNKLEENEEIGEEASHVKENLPAQDNDKIPQSLLSPDENQLDDKNQRRNEMTVDVSKTQKQETEDVDETHFHKDRPKLDDGEESKQKSQKTGKRKRNRSEQGKKENQDHTDRRGDDQMAAYSDSPAQPYLDEAAEVIKKKHTKQKVQTSHDAQNELDLKETRKNKNYKMAATLTGNQEADRDKETRQENFQSYKNKGSEDAEVRRQSSNQGAFEHKTVEIDVREFSPGGKGKTKLMIKTITEETTTVNNNNNRTTISDEGNVDCDLERGDLPSAKEETAILSEPLLQKQNPTSKKITRGANEDEYRLNISSDTDLEAQQKRHGMKKKCSCRCSCVIS